MSPISRAPSGPATTIGPSCPALHCLLLPRVQFNVSPASTSCKLPEGVEALSAPLNPIHGEVIPLHIGEFLPALQLGCSHSTKVLQMESFRVSCQPPVGEECRESCKAWLWVPCRLSVALGWEPTAVDIFASPRSEWCRNTKAMGTIPAVQRGTAVLQL